MTPLVLASAAVVAAFASGGGVTHISRSNARRSHAAAAIDTQQLRFAVLVDAENVQSSVRRLVQSRKLVGRTCVRQRHVSPLCALFAAPGQVFGEIMAALTANYGPAVVRRAYGDFTRPNLLKWHEVIAEHSFRAVQQFAACAGKSSSDFALVIDAMDLLHRSTTADGCALDGFCIVSSDSDFTALAQRLRESGRLVVGVGQLKTPKPFVRACTAFHYVEALRGDDSALAHVADGVVRRLPRPILPPPGCGLCPGSPLTAGLSARPLSLPLALACCPPGGCCCD